ncbi:MAG: hypothetical protein MR415_02950 [Coriobacteriaceae bacterium]|uniref:hypothetical protein n=1 Tax=Tractidigestivibacter sp. TaxID=2847320 RepID=UPI002A7FB68A|nr:hypothetical protein [Tractidigestivibacter sp.]MCI6547588.1 hypothetical protein [Coriobacteriaceae bacterium]MCI7438321.1 hypothetical protein [Coriobacteriaceae bacterium]MDD7584258.1 hypothetical protein [Coriobacteriaceae bacterium]MDY4534526.1 hypothetical protein [Tractidigestivibacter sp.]
MRRVDGRLYVRELRADFRHWYGVRYEDVAADEAMDLIYCLPSGSAYLAALNPQWAWSAEHGAIADVCDLLLRHERLSATGTTEGAQRVTRPGDVYERRNALEKAKKAKKKMETTKWELVDDG